LTLTKTIHRQVSHGFGVRTSRTFKPESTVKIPENAIAAEKPEPCSGNSLTDMRKKSDGWHFPGLIEGEEFELRGSGIDVIPQGCD
jgi:hypothetical protein